MSVIPGPKCPLCKGDKINFVGRPQISKEAAPYIREDYRVAECGSCEYYFVFPEITLTGQEWEKLYGKEYFSENPPRWARKRAEHRKLRFGMLEKFTRIKINKFLDIGCGEGYVLADAHKRNWDTVGLDIYDNRLDITKTDRITFIKGNIFQAAFPDDYFDCVYMDSVLEHVIDPIGLLREVHRILREGGVAYIGIPNENSLFNDVRKLIFTILGRGNISVRIKPFKTPFHVIGFTERSFKKIIAENGFELARFRIFGGEHDWIKFRVISRGFLINFSLLPVHLTAILLRKRTYMDAVIRKISES